MKILSIGNSFSQDAQRYLHALAKVEGVDLKTVNLKTDFETQVPIFNPNYYFGLKDSPQFGRSSAENRTGSSAWFL